MSYVTVNESYEVLYDRDTDPIHLAIENIKSVVIDQKLFNHKKLPTQEQVFESIDNVKISILAYGVEPEDKRKSKKKPDSVRLPSTELKESAVAQLEEIKCLLSFKSIRSEIKKCALTQVFTEVQNQSLKPSHLIKALMNLRLAETQLGQAAHEIAYSQLELQANEFLIRHPEVTTNAKFNRNYLIDSCAEKYGFTVKY